MGKIRASQLDQLLANTGDMCLKRRAKEILLGLDPSLSDAVLDAGCGDGFFLHLLSQLGKYSLTGLDDNPKALDLARKYVKSPNLKLVEGDVMNMPFKKGSFSRIICSEVLEHLPDDVAGLKEFARVLTPGGLVAITVPCLNYPFLWDPINRTLEDVFKFHFKDGFWAGIWNQHIRLYTVDSLSAVIKKAGLKIIEVKGITHYCIPFNHHLLNIGYRMRKSSHLPSTITSSLNKFSNTSSSRSMYQRALHFVELVDKLNDQRAFSPNESSVGVFALAVKSKSA